jgi:hypothetical protein
MGPIIIMDSLGKIKKLGRKSNISESIKGGII